MFCGLRKGVSPLIAAVLLIAFTMAVAGLAGPWFSSLIQQQTSDTSDELDTVTAAASSDIEIEQIKYNESSGNYTVSVRNSGDKDIENLTFTVTGEENVQKKLDKKLGKGSIETVTIETDNSTSKSKLSVSARNLPVSSEKDLTDDDNVQTVSSTNNNGGGGGNSAPTASFSANTTSVNTGEVFEVDASGSSDSDGSISSYEWDWTSDSTYEGTGVTQTHSYGSTGTYTVELKVTDDSGATDTGTSNIDVIDGPTVETLSAVSINSDNATLKGNVTDTGGETPDVRFNYGTDSNTLSNTVEVGTSSGEFSKTVTGLNSGTTYYFEAEANNSGGTATGSVLSFTTGTTTTTVDSFEDGDINEYSGNTGAFSVVSTESYDGSNSLKSSTTNSNVIHSAAGNRNISRGDKFSFWWKVNTRDRDVGFSFGYDDSTQSGYGISWLSTDRSEGEDLQLTKIDNSIYPIDGTRIDSVDSVSKPTNEWVEFEVDFQDTISVTVKDSSGNTLHTLSATDSTYDEAGISWFANAGSSGTIWYDNLEKIN